MESFKIAYTVLGGLGIFFFGMKTMSDSLQAIAGEMIKKIINSLTSNRILAVAVGTVITMIIQSSSVTTVMVIGFVNAGLMQLTQAIGVILGANIGTTITGWIISIKIGKYGLLFIALGIFPALFGKSVKSSNIGKLIFSIGLIFFGLTIMSDAFKPLRSMPEFLDAISYFSGNHYGAYLASIMTGCLLTMIIQSSSAMLGITMAMATSGIIDFQTAAALVLGENIGTTVTALLASIGGNVHAKRAAHAHAIFNVFGVLIILSFFPFYIEFIEWLIPGDANFVNAAGEHSNIAVHIASSHTVFNVMATICFIPFLKVLANFVTKITPDKMIKEQHHLVVLGNPTEMIPATAMVQSETELTKLKDIVTRMFNLSKTYLQGEQHDAKTLAKIKDYERITDNIQKEITLFVCKLMEKELSPAQSCNSQGIVRIADELESVADYLDRLVTYHTRFNQKELLHGEARDEFFKFFDNVHNFYKTVCNSLLDRQIHDASVIDRKSEELRVLAESIREKHIERVSKGTYGPLTALTYSDMVVALRKIRSHTHNISQALTRLDKACEAQKNG